MVVVTILYATVILRSSDLVKVRPSAPGLAAVGIGDEPNTLTIAGAGEDLERLAAALMLAAAEMREAALVEPLDGAA